MQPFWHFPATAGGQVNSINNAGIETFRGNELDSLTREICGVGGTYLVLGWHVPGTSLAPRWYFPGTYRVPNK